MEKSDEQSYKSELVLGKIYHAVKIDNQYDKVLEKEFQYSNKLQYRLLTWVIDPKGYERLTYACRWL